MKKCKYCGTQYADHLSTCPGCGANVVVSEKDINAEEVVTPIAKKTKLAPGKKILIAMCSIIAVLAIVIVATTVLNNQPVTTDGKSNNDLAKEYNLAMESMELGNYEKAIAEFDGISTEYKDYDKVTKQREKALEAYREQVLTQVDSYVAVGRHNDALSALTMAMNKYGETKELLQKKDEILYGYKQGVFAEVESYATTGDYATAIKHLQMLLEVVGEDADTELKIKYYEKSQVLKQVQTYESENNYTAAIEYLEKKLEELGQDADLATKLTSLLSTYKISCVDTAKAYVAEGDYDAAITVLENLSEAIGTDSEVSTMISDYKKALALEKVQTYIDNGNYLEGIEYMRLQTQVLGEDSSLSLKMNELCSLYKTLVMQNAENEAKNGKYASAVTTLKTLVSTIGSDADIELKISEYRKKEITVKLTEFDKNKDYAGAISYMQNEVPEVNNDSELKAKLEDYISKYKKDLFAEAATAYEENGFTAAVQLLNNDKLLKNDSELKEKIEYYKNKAPVQLSSLEPYQKKNMKYSSTTIEDVAGNQYQEFYYGEWHENAYYVYFLDNQYERLQCKFVMIFADNVRKSTVDVSIVIRDDDTNEVLYNGKLDSKNVEGIKIDVDISQVKFLKIELNNSPKNYAVMVDAQLIKK